MEEGSKAYIVVGSSSPGAEAGEDEAGEASLTGDRKPHRLWMSFSRPRAATTLRAAARLRALSCFWHGGVHDR
jgi:hypothetical protein